jgi:uncharacterized damage-inducible protein DinB
MHFVTYQIVGAKEHEMHHRAQLILIERQRGVFPNSLMNG